MYTTQLSHTDKAIINNEIMDFVPKRILDIHAHLYASHHFDKTAFPFLHNNSSLNFIKYKEAMVRTLGERKVDGLLFGMPHKSGNRPAITEWFYKAIADSAMSKALKLISPEDETGEVRCLASAKIKSHEFSGLDQLYYLDFYAIERFGNTKFKRCY